MTMNLNIKLPTLLFVLFLSLTSLNIKSQTSTLRGIIYEQETGEPSFGTNVKIKGTGIGASTDLNGFYQITKLKAGKLTIEISNIEFQTIEIDLELNQGKF